RGTLMKDMLRTLIRLDPAFSARRFAMIEASPRLASVQKETLSTGPVAPEWHAHVDELPPAPLFIIGNELFDAVPIRQYVKTHTGWRERVVSRSNEDTLCFLSGVGTPDPSLLPPDAHEAPEGAIFETAP